MTEQEHRVIVCGTRHAETMWADAYSFICGFLDEYHQKHAITLLGHGSAPGVDTVAEHWARSRDVPYLGWPARWTALGRKAGPIRNSALVKKLKPHVCIAFPGGDGTADMVRKCRTAGATVEEVKRP